MEYYFVVFVLLPIVFLILALLLVKVLTFLERLLNDSNPINVWLKENNHIYDTKWLSNRFEMIFWILLIILMVGLTIVYS
jgi:hypothetical protein